MVTIDNKKMQKNAITYECKVCDFIAFNKYNYNKHLSTLKHKNNENDNNDNKKVVKNVKNEVNVFVCEHCNKSYTYKSGLSRHKKTCKFIIQNNNDISCNNGSVINENMIIKELKDIICQQQKQINELIPNIGSNNNNNNNTYNQKFNIHLFLNEKCKDAINMSDFIKSIEVSLQQLEFTRKNGVVDGISNAIVENMNKLSLYERPMHCTDIKRETLYIKDDDNWKKEENKEKLKAVIEKASDKNFNALNEWKNNNPDISNNESKQEYFTQVISEIGKTNENINDKIIKNLCKETYIKNCN
tara:strand:- start:534 stop:1436 length:903 start_codon:yes stop_codon:yes gene_type:complete